MAIILVNSLFKKKKKVFQFKLGDVCKFFYLISNFLNIFSLCFQSFDVFFIVSVNIDIKKSYTQYI